MRNKMIGFQILASLFVIIFHINTACAGLFGSKIELEVTCDKLGAEVYIDNIKKGECPIVLSISSGNHIIQLKAVDNGKEYFFEKNITLGSDVVRKKINASLESVESGC